MRFVALLLGAGLVASCDFNLAPHPTCPPPTDTVWAYNYHRTDSVPALLRVCWW